MLHSSLSFQQFSGAIDLKGFRPISLVSGIYKINAKVLANSLKMVLEKADPRPCSHC
jgi:hypothetical protein